jgi:acyl-CoA synthetase (AMP-forming)/AMP-acid ligase II
VIVRLDRRPDHNIPVDRKQHPELISYVREHVHDFSALNRVFIAKELPKSTAGKILKREIREKLRVAMV